MQIKENVVEAHTWLDFFWKFIRTFKCSYTVLYLYLSTIIIANSKLALQSWMDWWYWLMLLGSAKLQCTQCQHVYSRKSTLMRHIRYECGKRPQFLCKICKHSFKHKHSLQSHIVHLHPKQMEKSDQRKSHYDNILRSFGITLPGLVTIYNIFIQLF